jgi:hypothetical protein
VRGGEAHDEAAIESFVCAGSAVGGAGASGLVSSGAGTSSGGGGALTAGAVPGSIGKVVHHRCGYTLWAFVVERFAADEYDWIARQEAASVLVNYRDPANGQVVFMCPCCGKPLKLWWEVSE